MDALSLLTKGIAEVSYQIDQALLGLGDDALDFRPHSTALSLREQYEHLTEVYLAVQALSKGETFSWGAFKSEATTVEALRTEMQAERQRAVATVTDTDGSIGSGLSFLVIHEGYHVGQICTLHHAFDPSWSSFAIYPH